MSFYIYDIVKLKNSNDNELYVISEKNKDHYGIRSLKDGFYSSWYYDDNLEYVDRAEREIFDKLDKKKEEAIEKRRDLNYIKENFPNISSTSWLYLFEKIGYRSSFYGNGEYFILDCEIQTLYPVFKALFDNDIDKALENLLKVFQPSYLKEYRNNILKFYEEINKNE